MKISKYIDSQIVAILKKAAAVGSMLGLHCERGLSYVNFHK